MFKSYSPLSSSVMAVFQFILITLFVAIGAQEPGPVDPNPDEVQIQPQQVSLDSGIPPGYVADLFQNQIGVYPVVSTVSGPVRGFRTVSSRLGTVYDAFLGIPFAEPPVGPLRFKAPVPVANWTFIRDATTAGATCYTPSSPFDVSEDCLFLNVYSPDTSGASEPKAVLVFIYGGAFSSGSSNPSLYGPDFLIDQNIVLVTLNYRTGPLGFLSLQNAVAPGNAGLKDQLLALRWVQDNIIYFGGDPSKVTIFGESAGAASVNYHIISKSSQGLFSQAILESGTAINPWAFSTPDRAVQKAQALGQKVGCSADQLDECLMTALPKDLTDNQSGTVSLQDYVNLNIFAFLPTTEIPAEGAFITEDPRKSMREGSFNKDVAIILGSNSQESILLLPTLQSADPTGVLSAALGLDLSIFAPHTLKLDKAPLFVPYVNTKMSFFYFNGLPLGIYNRNELLNLITDTEFVLQIQEATQYFTRFSTKPVFNYRFTYDGPYGLFKSQANLTNTPGVAHADELGYLFNSAPLRNIYNHANSASPQEQTIDRLTTMWANFAVFGEPVPILTTQLQARWDPAHLSGTSPYIDLGAPPTSASCLQCKNMKFWNDLQNNVVGEKPYLT